MPCSCPRRRPAPPRHAPGAIFVDQLAHRGRGFRVHRPGVIQPLAIATIGLRVLHRPARRAECVGDACLSILGKLSDVPARGDRGWPEPRSGPASGTVRLYKNGRTWQDKLEGRNAVDFDALILRDGDRVTASGRLVHDGTGNWFEPPMWVAAPGGLPRRVRPVWRGAVGVVGVNFDEVSSRFEQDGAVDGFATVTGTWRHDHLRADEQAPDGGDDYQPTRWVTPPCPAPEGGWPRPAWGDGDKNLTYDLGDLRETGAVVAATTFRPSDDQAVLVIAAADPDLVEARLKPQLGALLCVIPSRWTTAELEAVGAYLRGHSQEWNLLQFGPHSNEDGQPCMAARLARVSPQIAFWAASLPADILTLDPWLVPGRNREPS